MDWKRLDEVFGKAGEVAPDGSWKVTIPRADIALTNARGMPVPVGLGVNSYAAFTGTLTDATAVGDTCLLEHEVQPTIDALRAGGIEVVALHNHMVGTKPELLFMHFQGRGAALDLGKAIKRAMDLLGKPAPAEAAKPPVGVAQAVDAPALAAILGRPGPVLKDGIYKATLPRSDLSVSLDGRRLPSSVGLACWAAFSPCACGKTMVMGDTCVTRGELQGAIDALRRGGLSVTGIHNHLLGTSAAVIFLHFEGDGEAAALARTVRSVWDGLGNVRVFDFEQGEAGRPLGFSDAPAWLVAGDASAPSGKRILVQTGADAANSKYPLLLLEAPQPADLALKVRFKAVAGALDQAAGLVLRAQDSDNYYIARANTLEDNIRFYKFVAGKRIQLASADVKVPGNVWHELGLSAAGRRFEVTFNGQPLFVFEDDTFKEGGKVGLWTKADSVTHFDDFTVRPAAR